MAEQNLLVVGASGLIGGTLLQACIGLGRTYGTYYTRVKEDLIPLDIRALGQVKTVFRQVQPSLVLLVAAESNVDLCEKDPTSSFSVNVRGTYNIVRQCIDRDAKLVYISTDYVFDGLAGPYSEKNDTSPVNIYGQHKQKAEQIVRQSLNNYLIVRTSLVYGFAPGLRSTNILDCLRRNESYSAASDQFNSPTYVTDLANGITNLLRNEKGGTYHLAGPSTCSRYKFARMLSKTFDLDQSLIRSRAENDRLNSNRAPRPRRCGLIIDKAIREANYRPLEIQEGLLQMRCEMEKAEREQRHL
jgi:dTDP-4-dehydrorhamnose reductase